MNSLIRPLLVLSVLLPLAASAQVVIPDTTYTSGQTTAVHRSVAITTGTSTVTVPAVANVTYQSSVSVTLKPGFHAQAGSVFRAYIGEGSAVEWGGIDSDGDGLPDAWEYFYAGSGDLTTLAGSGNNDADPTTNLAEYHAGSNPFLNPSTSDTLGNARVVIRLHGGTFRKVSNDDSWTITTAP